MAAEAIENDHEDLLSAYVSEACLRNRIDSCSSLSIFEEGWASLDGRFPALQEFCGGLATVFPITATVESDFALINWEKDEFSKGIADLSLEGILHCKQFDDMRKFSTMLTNIEINAVRVIEVE
jgi:hypothetical protein